MVMDFNVLENFDKEQPAFTAKCQEINQAIINKNLTITQLVENLGPLLVNPNPEKRELGTVVLSQTLEEIPSNFLEERQLKIICDFYADKLKDSHQVIPPVLRGILALVHFTQFPKEATNKILTSIFHNVSCQSQQQHVRGIIFKIFARIQEKQTDEILSMAYDYVYGIISAVDGERDPKNLMFLFNWIPSFLKVVKLGHLTEEAFEILACYFPVDFKAPPQDPNGITREALAKSLAPCLTAIPEFAPFCLPLAIEKLDSSLTIAKLDSLELLRKGCSTFDSQIFVQFATQLWSQIQKELTTCYDPNLEKELLSTLTEIVRKISADADFFQATLKDIIDTIKGNLLPDSKLFDKSSKFLIAVSFATSLSSTLICQEIKPLLENTFNITESPEKRARVLEVLVGLQSPDVGILALKAAVDNNDGLRAVGFRSLAKINLNDKLRGAVFTNLGLLLTMEQSGCVRNALLYCLNELGMKYSEETLQFIKNMRINSLNLFLDSLLVLTNNNHFTEFVLNKHLEFLLNKESTEITLSCFVKLVQKSKYAIKINHLELIINWIINEKYETNNDNYQINLMNIINLLQQSYDSETQKNLLSKYLNKLNLKIPNHIFILSGLLTSVRRDVDFDYNFLDNLTTASTGDDLRAEIGRQLLANLTNKCENATILEPYLENLSTKNLPHKFIAWISKSLFMRNHPQNDLWINKLVHLLSDNKEIAADFRVLMRDDFDCLSPSSFCTRNIFYQQKLLIIVGKKLCDNYTPEKSQFLTALGYLLEGVPLEILTQHFERFLKFVILSLEANEIPEVLCTLLSTINIFISKKENFMQQHYADFLSRLLKLSTHNPFMKVRILSLQCIKSFALSGWDIHRLLPHKQEVLNSLQKSIDDKKRLVRKEAMEARIYWCLLDDPI